MTQVAGKPFRIRKVRNRKGALAFVPHQKRGEGEKKREKRKKKKVRKRRWDPYTHREIFGP